MKPLTEPPASYNYTLEDNKKILYVCGPHGAGKSTLFNDLKQYKNTRIQEQIAHMESLEENLQRQIWRTALHCIEHRENLVCAASLPENSVVVGDRCLLDDEAYVKAFEKLGWMTSSQCQYIFDLVELTYKDTPKPENFVILLPPLDWNIERIIERWNKGEEAKWCEHNFEYLEVVRKEFKTLSMSNRNILTITETNREDRIKRVKEWLVKNNLNDFIVEGRLYIEADYQSGGS